ncbi:MAG: hypothetical protein ACI9Y1_002922 [Lentisphaeria bacterium]
MTLRKKAFATFEKASDKAKPKNINDIFEALNLMLKNIGISMEAFNQFVANPK